MQNRKFKVVQIIDRLNIGGTERVVVTLSNLLQQHGHKVKVIITVNPGPLANQLDKEIKLVNLNRKWKWNPLTMRHLIKEVKDCDIIHVHSSYNLRYLYLAAKLFRLNKPIFFHEHYGDIHIDPSVKWHQKLIYPGVIFIGVSQQHTQWALQQLKMSPERVFLLPNTIEKIYVPPSEKKSNNLKQLLLVSNFRSTKNIEFALELFKLLKNENGSNYHLTIIGQVADKLYYEKIKDGIIKNELEQDITIITDSTNIQPLLNQFDLALHTAISESGPLVLIEYMAQGLPFITYNTGEVAEEIKNKIPLAVMHAFDKDEWLKRIQTFLSLPMDDLSNKLLNLYDHYFSAEAYYNKVIEIYESILYKEENSSYRNETT
jgi:glycosyltransferase involved in cell wall biosynthesis